MENIKQEVIDKLKGKRVMRCPKCKGDKFFRTETARCRIVDYGDELRDEDIEDEGYEYQCRNCDEWLSTEEMI